MIYLEQLASRIKFSSLLECAPHEKKVVYAVCQYKLHQRSASLPAAMTERTALKNSLEEKTCSLTGKPSELPHNVLPCNGDILRFWRFLGITNLKPGKIPSRQEKCSDISLIVFGLWEKASVPSICLKSIYNRVNKLIEKYQNVRKSINKTSEVSINMRDKFSTCLTQLFDVAACKCVSFQSCKCNKAAKVPKEEQVFLIDQRDKRKIFIYSWN